MSSRRVVITGLGALTPIGNDVNAMWENMLAGKSGAKLITKFDTTDFATKFACEVKNFNVEDYISKKEANRMDLFTQYAIAASSMAMDDANFDLDNIDKESLTILVQNFQPQYGNASGLIYSFRDIDVKCQQGNDQDKQLTLFLAHTAV